MEKQVIYLTYNKDIDTNSIVTSCIAQYANPNKKQLSKDGSTIIYSDYISDEDLQQVQNDIYRKLIKYGDELRKIEEYKTIIKQVKSGEKDRIFISNYDYVADYLREKLGKQMYSRFLDDLTKEYEQGLKKQVIYKVYDAKPYEIKIISNCAIELGYNPIPYTKMFNNMTIFEDYITDYDLKKLKNMIFKKLHSRRIKDQLHREGIKYVARDYTQNNKHVMILCNKKMTKFVTKVDDRCSFVGYDNLRDAKKLATIWSKEK